MAEVCTAVVIGGTSGIGHAIALGFAPAARFFGTYVGDAASVGALARAAEEAFGVPHVVTNCAGVQQSGKRVLDQDLDEDAEMWRVTGGR